MWIYPGPNIICYWAITANSRTENKKDPREAQKNEVLWKAVINSDFLV